MRTKATKEKRQLIGRGIEKLEARRLFTTFSMTDVANPTSETVTIDYSKTQQTSNVSFTVNTTFAASSNDAGDTISGIQLNIDTAGGTLVPGSISSGALTSSDGQSFSANGSLSPTSYTITEQLTWANTNLDLKVITLSGTISTQNRGSKPIAAPATQRITLPAGNFDLKGLAIADKHSTGGFVSLKSDDDNKDGKPDYLNTDDTGENDLVPLTLHASSAGGRYQLEFTDSGASQGIKVWEKADKTAADASDHILNAPTGSPVYRIGSDSTIIDASVETTLYVEGVQASGGLAADNIVLKWKVDPGATAPYFTADEMKLTVYSVAVKSIDFDGTNNENIRIDASTDIGDGSGGTNDVEWIKGTRDKANTTAAWATDQAAPTAFVEGSSVQADVAVTVSPAIFSSVTIEGDSKDIYGNFAAAPVSLTSGNGHATFTTDDSDAAVDQNDVSFQWHINSLTLASGTNVSSTQDIEKSTNRIYNVVAKSVGTVTEPWAVMLELATGLAKAELGDNAAVMTDLTRGIYNSSWTTFGAAAHFINPTAPLYYDPAAGGFTTFTGPATDVLSQMSVQTTNISSFITAIQGTGRVHRQCCDNANLLSLMAASLGITAQSETVVGARDLSVALTTATYLGAGWGAAATPPRTDTFTFHQFVVFGNQVYDPSTAAVTPPVILPWTGVNIPAYMNTVFPAQNFIPQLVSTLTEI